MSKEVLLILGFALLSMGLRSTTHPLLHRLGTFCILITSYLVGEWLTGLWWVGLITASLWLWLPWLEILTRLRQMRLPERKAVGSRRAPSGEEFPALREISHELEEEGFEQVDDIGWEWEEHRQFLRLFYKPDECLQAAICLVDEGDFAFYYVSFSSRDAEGGNWTTWNFPFSQALKVPPGIRLNRVRADASIIDLIGRHRAFFSQSGQKAVALEEEGAMQGEIEREMREQIAYNVRSGLLSETGEGTVRYTWRGMVYVWAQFLRDFVRFS